MQRLCGALATAASSAAHGHPLLRLPSRAHMQPWPMLLACRWASAPLPTRGPRPWLLLLTSCGCRYAGVWWGPGRLCCHGCRLGSCGQPANHSLFAAREMQFAGLTRGCPGAASVVSAPPTIPTKLAPSALQKETRTDDITCIVIFFQDLDHRQQQQHAQQQHQRGRSGKQAARCVVGPVGAAMHGMRMRMLAC